MEHVSLRVSIALFRQETGVSQRVQRQAIFVTPRKSSCSSFFPFESSEDAAESPTLDREITTDDLLDQKSLNQRDKNIIY